MKRYQKMTLSKKAIALLTAAVLAIAAVTTVVVARFIHSSSVDNVFEPEYYDRPAITKTDAVDGTTQLYSLSSLTVTPAAGLQYPVYVRVAVVPNWKDAQGNLYGLPPLADVDYTITYNTEDWQKIGDYYYCITPVLHDATPDLFGSGKQLSQIKSASEAGYTFHVELLAETVQAIGTRQPTGGQAVGTEAVLDAWGVKPSA